MNHKCFFNKMREIRVELHVCIVHYELGQLNRRTRADQGGPGRTRADQARPSFLVQLVITSNCAYCVDIFVLLIVGIFAMVVVTILSVCFLPLLNCKVDFRKQTVSKKCNSSKHVWAVQI